MNELLFFITLLICFSMTLIFYKIFKKEGLFVWIAIATIIANIQTVKLVNLFGIESALGTILYGSTFLATDILNEKYGKESAFKALKIGFISMIAMTILMTLSLIYIPSESDIANESLKLIFTLNIRITIASLIGFACSQLVDTNLYDFLKNRTRKLWIRNNISTIVSQIIDTCLFVAISYSGIVDFSTLFNIAISMFIFKFIIAILDTPFMYLSKIINNKEK
ncbi:conserved hypothetical integral membrane protein [Firmicutes bacterium CAG:884]|nr:conserved hypothetical integral membrane protein [Firmicutes bacterium CAG:884]